MVEAPTLVRPFSPREQFGFHSFDGAEPMNRISQALILLVVVSVPAYAGSVQVTPEPATIGLVLTGLGAIGVGAWWKRRR
jgi:hypothetical protein